MANENTLIESQREMSCEVDKTYIYYDFRTCWKKSVT